MINWYKYGSTTFTLDILGLLLKYGIRDASISNGDSENMEKTVIKVRILCGTLWYPIFQQTQVQTELGSRPGPQITNVL